MSQSSRFVLRRDLSPHLLDAVRVYLAAFVRGRYRLAQEDGVITVHVWRERERQLLMRSLSPVVETVEADD